MFLGTQEGSHIETKGAIELLRTSLDFYTWRPPHLLGVLPGNRIPAP